VIALPASGVTNGMCTSMEESVLVGTIYKYLCSVWSVLLLCTELVLNVSVDLFDVVWLG